MYIFSARALASCRWRPLSSNVRRHIQKVPLMDTVATYLPPIIAFAAMFIGLLGPGRASDRTGIKAITPFGWTSCAVGAASLLVSLYIQYRKDEDLAAALQSRLQMRAVVTRELKLGVESLRSVLRYAALMPHFTTSQTVQTFPDDLPYPKYRISRLARDIDLRSPEVIGVLERLYVSPSARMKAPVIPSAMPFGTHVAKPCMSVLVDESRAAASRIESAVQKYAAVALTPEVISAGSELATSPF